MGEPLLEVGCGFGRVVIDLASIGWSNLTGLDFSGIMVKRARLFARAMNVEKRTRFIQGLANRLVEPYGPFKRESFTIVLFIIVLLHIVDEEEFGQALAEAAAVLKEGGLLIIAEPLLEDNPQYSSLEKGLKHSFTRIRRRSVFVSTLNSLGMRWVDRKRFKFFDEIYTIMWFKKVSSSNLEQTS